MNFSEINEFSLNVSLIQSLSQSASRLLKSSEDLSGTINIAINELNKLFVKINDSVVCDATTINDKTIDDFLISLRMNREEIYNDLKFIYNDEEHYNILKNYIYKNISN